MKKNLKKVLAASLAASMVMSMTAFAGTVTTTNTDSEGKVTNSSIQVDDSQKDAVQDKLDDNPVVPKVYNELSGTSPAETFTYSFTPQTYVNGDDVTYTYDSTADAFIATGKANIDVVDINDVTISFTEGDADRDKVAEVPVDADAFKLGVYKYEVSEVVTTQNAGVTYSNENLYLVLTILRDEASNKHFVAAMHYEDAEGTDKSSGFTNSYEAGSLTVTKEIEGNMADMTKEFAFTVKFEAAGSSVIASTIGLKKAGVVATADDYKVEYVKDSNNNITGMTYTFELTHGETFEFTNVPTTVEYEVYENKENYEQAVDWVEDVTGETTTSQKTVETKGIVVDGAVDRLIEKAGDTADTDAITFTNTLTNEIDTGISLDSMPYLMTLALSAMGALGFAGKRRKEEDEI